MKKELCFLLVILILFPLVSAINLDLRSSYKPGETIIASIAGNFIEPLSPENFYFSSDGYQTPMLFDIAKIQDKYYFYALLTSDERDYTLDIRGLHYFENGKEIRGDLQRNFSVAGNVTDFSVSPGFLVMKNDSEIVLESKNQPLTITAKFLNTTQEIYVPIGQNRKLKFSIAGVSSFQLTEIALSGSNTKYSIPVVIIPPSQVTIYINNVTETERFRFSKSSYNLSVYNKNETKFRISLQNSGNIPIKNIQINFSDSLKGTITLSPENIKELNESQSKQIEITLTPKTYRILNGNIYAFSENFLAESSLTINSMQQTITPDPPIITPPVEALKYCTDLEGEVCASAEECVGNTADSIDGLCCLGTCQQKKSYVGTIIGFILLAGLIAGLYYLYKRSKKKPEQKDLLQTETKKFEERMSNREIRGSLARS